MKVILEKVRTKNGFGKESEMLFITTTAPDGTHNRYLYSGYERSLINNNWTTGGAAALYDKPNLSEFGIVIAKKIINI